MNTPLKMIAGITAAALAGVGIGLLTAPKTGKESREKLRQGTNDLANKLLETVRTNGESLKEKAGNLVDDAKATYNQGKGYARAELNHGEEKVNKVL